MKLHFCTWNCRPADTELFVKFLDQNLEAARNVMARLNTHLPVRVLTSARYQKTARPSKTTLSLCDCHGNLKLYIAMVNLRHQKGKFFFDCLTEIVTKM